MPPPIYCHGRHYPEAPRAWTIGGCLRRPPPYAFRVQFPLFGFTGRWAVMNGQAVSRTYYQGSGDGVDPGSIWSTPAGALPPSAGMGLERLVIEGTWSIRVTLTDASGGPPAKRCRFLVKNGFVDDWQVPIAVPFLDTLFGWNFGQPASVDVRASTYNVLPADFCIRAPPQP